MWIWIIIFLQFAYLTFTSQKFEIISFNDKLILTVIVSFILSLIAFPFQLLFFQVADVFLVKFLSNKRV
jgi:hypothetical protein